MSLLYFCHSLNLVTFVFINEHVIVLDFGLN